MAGNARSGQRGFCAAFTVDMSTRCRYQPEPNSKYCRLHQKDEQSGRFEREALRRMSNVDPEVVVTKPKMNPLEALNTFIEQIMSWNDLAEKQIKKLKEDEWRYEDRAGGEQLRSEIAIYERSLDRGLRALQAVAKLNLAEKYIALSEKQAELMFIVMIETLTQLGVDGNSREVQQVLLQNVQRLSNQSERKLAELTK
jgi:hypothetical protein